MAREEFLRSLRAAASLLSPTAQANGIRLDADHLTGLLRRATLWLTPRSMEGYDERDFDDLAEPLRQRLTRDVEKFKQVAGRVPADEPAPDAELREATPIFLAILAAMGPYLEGFRVDAALRKQAFPEVVRDFAVKVGRDSTGDPAAWIWVVVEDRDANKALVGQIPEIQQRVDDAFERAGIPLYPYVLFRSRSDQRQLEAELSR